MAQDLPNKVYLELTTECNLDCAMCIRHSWADEGGSMSGGTFEAARAGLEGMESITTVSLSGFGEPMVHPGFRGFLARLKGAGLYVEVITNGLCLDASSAGRLMDLELDRVIVSLDGIGEGSSRMLHAGSFKAVSANLRALNELRLARGLQVPQVDIEFVATKRNIHELPELKRLAWVLGFSTILVTNVIPHTRELAAETLYEHWNTTSRRREASPCLDCGNCDLREANMEDCTSDQHPRCGECLWAAGLIQCP